MEKSPCGSKTETEPSKGNSHDRAGSQIPQHRRVELLALVCATQSADRNLVRLPRRVPSLSLKADTKMKTTNLKQTSVAKPRKWFQRRRCWHDPREARAERSQFRDQRSRLHLREFAKNSRISAAFAPGANRAPQFSSLAHQLLRPRLARDELIPP